ncbi:MAG: mevalonate kinase [Chitinophagales bacterium]
MTDSYPAKILLFGEYAVLCGGEGLAIPDFDFKMRWDIGSGPTSNLSDFAEYIRNNSKLNALIDFNAFLNDLEQGYYLFSNIPEGYGVGSSGAVVAAVFDRYAVNPIQKNNKVDLDYLRSTLSEMENFFHAKSSGIDPLVSLIQKPVHVRSDGTVEILETEIMLTKYFEVDLYDTHQPRNSSAVIDQFMFKMKKPEFRESIEDSYLGLVSDCIRNCTMNEFGILQSSLIKLSEFQLTHFNFAIPTAIQQEWKKALNSGNEIYKLCGAGGGGFMIRFLSKN